MKLKDKQLILKIISECKDIIKYASNIDEKSFLEEPYLKQST